MTHAREGCRLRHRTDRNIAYSRDLVHTSSIYHTLCAEIAGQPAPSLLAAAVPCRVCAEHSGMGGHPWPICACTLGRSHPWPACAHGGEVYAEPAPRCCAEIIPLAMVGAWWRNRKLDFCLRMGGHGIGRVCHGWAMVAAPSLRSVQGGQPAEILPQCIGWPWVGAWWAHGRACAGWAHTA